MTEGVEQLQPADTQVRPGALALLTPAQRGLALAIVQADRCGRGGDDLVNLARSSRFMHDDESRKAQLSHRLAMLSSWPNRGPPRAVR